ncbi:2-hydroxyacid dehydrogenase [Devosia sp. RR2S18]|uniref:2-hydroxyacid dehydrogenase n=1 Tax=Devosia rhizosphaerae TaxID=3049774 RepID=UPI002541851C|nr:2-hydroxyacid dehydrogenase [Devosia sp. RR2S18]WIJ24689.1 2-hydroxyacid dehydrogenase [Devosia sp. RR2S18]
MAIDLLQTHKLLDTCEAALAERFTVHKLHEAADRDAFLAEVGPRIRAVAGGSVDADLMDRLPKLEIIANFGVGYDTIDTPAAKARNIRVTNTPSVLDDAVAETAMALMIALARQVPAADRFVREGKWEQGNFPFTTELRGATVGILGLGRIGKEIAARAQAFKMRIVYHGRQRQPTEPHLYYGDLEAMARDCDWLVIVAPGGPATQGIVSRQVLEALGPNGRLVNVARGSLVDEAALIDMLQSGGIAGAGLDVFADEPRVPAALRELDNVVLTPHYASATRTTRNAMGALVVANLDAHFAGNPLLSAVV